MDTVIDEWEGVVTVVLKNGDFCANVKRLGVPDAEWLPDILAKADAGDKPVQVGDRFVLRTGYEDSPSGRRRVTELEWTDGPNS